MSPEIELPANYVELLEAMKARISGARAQAQRTVNTLVAALEWDRLRQGRRIGAATFEASPGASRRADNGPYLNPLQFEIQHAKARRRLRVRG